jgi:hypothetical protein
VEIANAHSKEKGASPVNQVRDQVLIVFVEPEPTLQVRHESGTRVSASTTGRTAEGLKRLVAVVHFICSGLVRATNSPTFRSRPGIAFA